MIEVRGAISTAVFDLGNVVVQWHPREAFAGLLGDAEIDAFFAEIDFANWNRLQDAGVRSWDEAEAQLVRDHPQHALLAPVYRANYDRVVRTEVAGTGALLRQLQAGGVRLLAITNWSSELFVRTRRTFEIFSIFEGIVVSGVERLLKPDPAIYKLLFTRYGIDPAEAVFIDDTVANVIAAQKLGMRGVHFTDAQTLRDTLTAFGLLEATM